MTYETTIGRNIRGELRAKTIIALAFDSMQLHIETSKSSRGGLSTQASAVTPTPDGMGYSMIPPQDFSKTIAQDKTKRATEKNIAAMHAGALLNSDALIAEVGAFYVALKAKKAKLDEQERLAA